MNTVDPHYARRVLVRPLVAAVLSGEAELVVENWVLTLSSSMSSSVIDRLLRWRHCHTRRAMYAMVRGMGVMVATATGMTMVMSPKGASSLRAH